MKLYSNLIHHYLLYSYLIHHYHHNIMTICIHKYTHSHRSDMYIHHINCICYTYNCIINIPSLSYLKLILR